MSNDGLRPGQQSRAEVSRAIPDVPGRRRMGFDSADGSAESTFWDSEADRPATLVHGRPCARGVREGRAVRSDCFAVRIAKAHLRPRDALQSRSVTSAQTRGSSVTFPKLVTDQWVSNPSFLP